MTRISEKQMKQMTQHICPSCGNEQWSIVDQQYLKLFGHCWREDQDAWRAGTLSLEEFEKRETAAGHRGARVFP